MIEDVAEKIIVSLGTLVAVWAWKELAPRIAQRFYQEPLIGDTEWKTTFIEDGQEFHETVTLTQKGRRVIGEIILEDGDKSIKYRMSGVFRHLILTGTYEAMDPRDYEQGAFALKYTNNRLTGEHILLSRTSDQPISSNYKWERIEKR